MGNAFARNFKSLQGLSNADSFWTYFAADFSDMDKLPRTMKLEFADANDLFKFSLIITPDEGSDGPWNPIKPLNLT